MRTIGVVTVARSDYGIYLPVLKAIKKDPELRLYLIVAGMHLSPEFGLTIQAIEKDGFEIGDRIEMLLSSDSPEGVAKSMGLGTIGFAQSYGRFCPDILLVLGDRFEMLAGVVAALPFKIPVAHIHGGEITEGAIDDAIRHSITKMSHLHFASTEAYAKRIMQMGEEPWRVTVSGAPSLDNINQVSLLGFQQLEKEYHVNLESPFLLVTYHPVTLEYEETEFQIQEILKALAKTNMQVIFTYPNADTQGRLILEKINKFLTEYHKAQLIGNLGTQAYFSLMNLAAAMVGNSSSGIIEAASFKLPVVNIGNRQKGRVHGENVINVGYDCEGIFQGINKAISPQFRDSLTNLVNPYGEGKAAIRIIENLKQTNLNQNLIIKKFYSQLC